MDDDPEEKFLAHLALIDRIARASCRRRRLRPEEAEDFRAEVHLKLIADDYTVLRKFKGEARFSTYLTTVIQRLLADHCDRLWGRWRPSVVARRLGPTAEQLERLLVLEGHALADACQLLRARHGVTLTDDDLADIAARLPQRTRRRLVGDAELGSLADPQADAERDVRRREHDDLRRRVEEGVERALARLAPEDRWLARLRLMQGARVADIARSLGVEPAALYPRIEAVKRALRRHLQAEGIGPEALDALLSDRDAA